MPYLVGIHNQTPSQDVRRAWQPIQRRRAPQVPRCNPNHVFLCLLLMCMHAPVVCGGGLSVDLPSHVLGLTS